MQSEANRVNEEQFWVHYITSQWVYLELNYELKVIHKSQLDQCFHVSHNQSQVLWNHHKQTSFSFSTGHQIEHVKLFQSKLLLVMHSSILIPCWNNNHVLVIDFWNIFPLQDDHWLYCSFVPSPQHANTILTPIFFVSYGEDFDSFLACTVDCVNRWHVKNEWCFIHVHNEMQWLAVFVMVTDAFLLRIGREKQGPRFVILHGCRPGKYIKFYTCLAKILRAQPNFFI